MKGAPIWQNQTRILQVLSNICAATQAGQQPATILLLLLSVLLLRPPKFLRPQLLLLLLLLLLPLSKLQLLLPERVNVPCHTSHRAGVRPSQ